MVMIHVDDLLVVGKRDYVLGNFLKEFKAAYEISVLFLWPEPVAFRRVYGT